MQLRGFSSADLHALLRIRGEPVAEFVVDEEHGRRGGPRDGVAEGNGEIAQVRVIVNSKISRSTHAPKSVIMVGFTALPTPRIMEDSTSVAENRI